MKTSLKMAITVTVTVIAFNACKKSKKNTLEGALGPNYPYELNTIVTPAILDTLESHGMKIYAGLTPPIATGIYLLSPNYCTFDNSGSNEAGTIFTDELLKFSNQDNTTNTITYNYEQGGTEAGSDNAATFISGTGSSFSVYAQAKDTTDGISDVEIRVVSGVLTSGGINNLQEGLFVVSKGPDPYNKLIPVNSTRIFEDQDGISQIETSFAAFVAARKQTINNKNLKANTAFNNSQNTN